MSNLAGSESAIFPPESPVAASIAPQEMVGEGKAWGLCTSVDLQDCNPDLIRNRRQPTVVSQFSLKYETPQP